MDLHELLIYDRALTDEEIMAVSGVLMAKWNVPAQADGIPAPANPLSANAALTIAADATLDVNGLSQHVGSLTVEVAGTPPTLPRLAVMGALDVAGSALSFTGLGAAHGLFITTTQGMGGAFGETTGISTRRTVVLDAYSARVSRKAFLINFR